MADTFVVVNEKGQFWGWTKGRWVSEYPDAKLYASARQAVAAMKKAGVKGQVVGEYGLMDEWVAYEDA